MCMGASPKTSKSEQDYRAEEDFRTLQRAAEVSLDGARHQRAIGHGRKQMSAMSKVVGGMRGKTGRKGMRAPARRA